MNTSKVTHFHFNGFILSLAQEHETAHQLYHTIQEFKNLKPCDNKDHLVGKLKFFIDMYADISNIEFINETVVIDNYLEFAKILCSEYDDDALSDVYNDYHNYICEVITDIFKHIQDNAILDVDEALDYVSNYPNLNFQEQQFIMDCYYATCTDFKIMEFIDGKYHNETDYYLCLKQSAIVDYCKEHNCKPTDLLVRRIFNDSSVYTGPEFYEFMSQYGYDDLDFIIDYKEIFTIKGWLQYLINTLNDLNSDLNIFEETDIIQKNTEIIDFCKQFLIQ